MMCKRQGRGTQARILVADWDQDNALALAAIMRRAGFEVATACDGKEAVAEAAQFKPDVLVTEPYLGRLSGIQTAVDITTALPDCKVLFLSGEASMADIAKAAPPELVYSFTAKPIHPLDLLNVIAYLACAEWSTGDSAPAGTDADTQPGPSTPPHLNGNQDRKPASLAPCFGSRYLRSLLEPKREDTDQHITRRHEHAPA
jgi:CheY-like chemotaxis protein